MGVYHWCPLPFQGDIMRNYEDLISEQLEAGIETRIYVGVGEYSAKNALQVVVAACGRMCPVMH